MRCPQVSLSSTTYDFMTFLKEEYGDHISTHKTYKDHHKQSWSWKLSYNNAITFLTKIVIFLKEPEKIRRAKMLIEEYPGVVVRNGKYSEKQLIIREKFENKFFNQQ